MDITNGRKFNTPVNSYEDYGRYCDGYIFCKEGYQGTGCGRNGINGQCVKSSSLGGRRSKRRSRKNKRTRRR